MTTHLEKFGPKKSVLERKSGYREACDSGFRGKFWQAHHIACHHAVAGREIADDYVEYVEACLWITDWNLNAPANLIGLPVNLQYRFSDGKVPVNYCSHQVDHNTSNGYTDECKKWLKSNLWDTLKSKRKQHELTPKDVKATLQQCTSNFKAKLKSRGARKGGTQTCWKNRFRASYANSWYYPFSMAAKPNERHPGVDTDKWKKMVNIFKLLG